MNKPFLKKFGKRFQELRKSRNYTQKTFAAKIGRAPSIVSQIECGLKFISAETLFNSCKILNYRPKDFFEFDEDTSSTEKKLNFIIKKLRDNPHHIDKIYKLLDSIIDD